jgi:hypothetical protein
MLEVSSNGSSWSDATGRSVSVTTSQARKFSETNVGANDNPEVTAGFREAVKGQVRGLYTEDALHAFQLLLDAHEDGGCIYLRYAPRGGAASTKRYASGAADGSTAAPAIITNFIYPDGDKGSADPVMWGFDFVCSSLIQETISA